MPTPETFALFMSAALALLVMPGPVILYTTARTFHQGRSAGFASTVGVGLGDFTHVLAATLGLSTVLAASPPAFNVVKVAGAIYLAYLGIRTLFSHKGEVNDDAGAFTQQSPRQVFVQGWLVAVLNPKTALFFLAFLPQFVDRDRGSVAAQTLVLGSCFVTAGMAVNTVYTLLVSALGRRLHNGSGWSQVQRYLSGIVYLLLSAAAAFAH